MNATQSTVIKGICIFFALCAVAAGGWFIKMKLGSSQSSNNNSLNSKPSMPFSKQGARRAARNIGVLPEPLAGNFQYFSGMSDDKGSSVQLTSAEDAYPWLVIEKSRSTADGGTLINKFNLRKRGFLEYLEGTFSMSGKTLTYGIGHGTGLLKHCDLLIGHIADWTPDSSLNIEATSEVNRMPVKRIAALLSSMKLPGAKTDANTDATAEPEVFTISRARIAQIPDMPKPFEPADIANTTITNLIKSPTGACIAAPIIALAITTSGTKQISDMIRRDPKSGNYVVFFPADQNVYEVTERDLEEMDHQDMPVWDQVLTLALTKKYPDNVGLNGSADHWQPAIKTSLEALTALTIVSKEVDTMSEDEIIKVVNQNLKAHTPLIFSVKSEKEQASLSPDLKYDFAYPILAYDTISKKIMVPRASILAAIETGSKSNYGTLAPLSIDEFRRYAKYMAYPSPDQ